MARRLFSALLFAGLISGCHSAPPPRLAALTPPRRPAARFPISDGARCRLVAYHGLEVSYVEGASVETYRCRDLYYCYVDNRWFFSTSLSGPWSYLEMKYVPTDLFRARGRLPDGMSAGR